MIRRLLALGPWNLRGFALAASTLLGSVATAQDLYDIAKIRTIEIAAPSNWRTLMANNYSSKTLIKVDVTIDGKLYKEVGARHRGFSSYRFLPRGKTDKRPWKLLFDEYVPGQSVQGYRTLNISNNVWDPSLMREVVSFEFMRRFLKAPKCCFVKLKVNGESLGLFTNTQQINKDFLQEHFADDEGNRYRGDRASSRTPWNDTALTWLGGTLSRYQAAYELKTENGKHAAWTKLIQLTNVLNNTSTPQLPAALPKVLDIDNAMRFIAVANSTCWLDSYLGRTCKNFYLYEDPFHGQFTFQPWDVNNGFGGLTDGLGTRGIASLPPMYREFDSRYPRPLFGQVVKVPKWRATYLAHMRSMLPELNWAKIGKRIEALRKFIRPELLADSVDRPQCRINHHLGHNPTSDGVAIPVKILFLRVSKFHRRFPQQLPVQYHHSTIARVARPRMRPMRTSGDTIEKGTRRWCAPAVDKMMFWLFTRRSRPLWWGARWAARCLQYPCRRRGRARRSSQCRDNRLRPAASLPQSPSRAAATTHSCNG